MWICDKCPNVNFLFLFELFQHWRDFHASEFMVERNSNNELRLQEVLENDPNIALKRDKFLHENGLRCPLCSNSEKFEHKFQLVSHWFENHSNKSATYEICQWCMEIFTSTKHIEQVIYFKIC